MFQRIDRGPIEYYLRISREYDPKENREGIRFLFQTLEEFQHFRYEISIEHAVSKGRIDFTLKGLKTKGMLLPATGRAETAVLLHDLHGKYAVTVSKPGQETNDFSLDIKPRSIRVSAKADPVETFLEVSTA